MHILTGLIVASLLGKSEKYKKPAHLSLHGVIELVHYLPGRMRYRIPSLVGEEKIGKNIETQMRRLNGVKKVEVRPLVGSVLIEFQPETIEADMIYTVLVSLAGLDKQVERTPPSRVRKEIVNMGRFCNHMVYEKTKGVLDLRTLFPLMMVGVGIHRMMNQGVGLPSGFVLLWWAFQSLQRQGDQDS